MEVIVADNAGFCFGVKRAIKMANDTMDGGGAVKSLGSLIHILRSSARSGSAARVVADLDASIRRTRSSSGRTAWDRRSRTSALARAHGRGYRPAVRDQGAAVRAKLIAENYKVVMIGTRTTPR